MDNHFLQPLRETLFDTKKVEVFLLREDMRSPWLSGNKGRKLKYNLLAAQTAHHRRLLTFGGAYSNHLHAFSKAAAAYSFEAIAVVRGEENAAAPLNPTLRDCAEQGTQLHFVSRSQYRQRHQADFIQTLHLQFGDFFLIPEGGANEYGVQGCREIISEAGGADNMDYWCAACGTGTMLAGMIAACEEKSIVLGFPALPKAEFLYQDIERQLQPNHYRRWTLHTQYAAPQYARLNDELLQFIRRFYLQHRIVLDAVYTAKMMYGIYDLIQKDYFPAGSRIAAVHSGGLQGWHGMLQYHHQLPEIPWQLIQ